MNRPIRMVLFSLVILALAAPAFAFNVVNTSWTVNCVFSPTTCSVSGTDYVYEFPVSGGSGNGRLQSRIFQAQSGVAAGKWVYEYRINLGPVGGLTYPPYADYLAIESWGAIRQYDYNGDSVATDEVFNITSGGVGSKAVTAAWFDAPWTFFHLSNPVYAGNYPGGGESSYFFGLVSDRAPVLRYMWVHLDTGWVLVQGYAPPLP